jgi:hypothetical protein
MDHHHPHLAGDWNLIQVEHKLLPEPFEFHWKNDSVTFSYGNGHVCDFAVAADGTIKWGNHLETHLAHPTPHEPSEKEVVDALKHSHTYKIEHNKLHLFHSQHGKETMIFEKKH